MPPTHLMLGGAVLVAAPMRSRMLMPADRIRSFPSRSWTTTAASTHIGLPVRVTAEADSARHTRPQTALPTLPP